MKHAGGSKCLSIMSTVHARFFLQKKKAAEQNTDFGLGEGGGSLSFLKTSNVEANN